MMQIKTVAYYEQCFTHLSVPKNLFPQQISPLMSTTVQM